MKNWSIHKQIVVLAILPALFVGIILAGYFTYSQIEYISTSLQKHGQSIAAQIAPASEYAVYSGNTALLVPTLKNALNDQDVVAVIIKDKDNKILISQNDEALPSQQHSFWRKLIKTRLINFRIPITSQEVAINDFEEASSSVPENNNQIKHIIGYVELIVTTQFSDNEKFESLNKGILLTFIILVASFILALRVSKQIATPVRQLTNTVRKIASGDFKTRINQDAPGELGTLESYVNTMAGELQSYQGDMETRIDDFTRELQQTLEELEMRNAELDITRSNALAANRAKSEFLANMSHEIRTPLGGIIGFSELLDSTRMDEQQKDYVTTIRKSAGNLLNIIDDILDLSKIESGKLEISPVVFNLLDIIEEVVDLLSPVAYEKNIELLYDLHKDVPRLIEADPVRIRQVLINLIGNAIKFTEQGYVHLDISDAPEKTQNGIRFSVTDTGIGMSQSARQTLFHAFTQADTSITRRFGGTGLGLVISRKLTLLMDGKIDFDSVENQGSCFWFHIPVKIKDDTDTGFGDNLSGVHVVLLSKNELCHSAIRSMLEYWGCDVSDQNYDQNPQAETGNKTADITIACYSHEELSGLQKLNAGDNTSHTQPDIAIISSSSQESIKLVQSTGIDRVVFFSSPQKHIYSTLCKLIQQSTINPQGAVAHSVDASHDWSGIRTLVVDDNSINLRLAEIILKQHGAQVVAVSSGENAIEAAQSHAFDIIFMDIHMPGLDGYATTKRIRALETKPAPVIIALTANAMPAEKTRVYASGMNDIMIKPISEQLMNAVIQRWLGSASKTTANHPQETGDTIVFSMEEAEKFTSGNAALAIELVNMLKQELPDYQHGIAQAIQSHDHGALKVQVHKLHGATRCCGTPALRNAAETLERVIDSEQCDELDAATNRLMHEISRLLEHSISAAELN